MEITSKKIPYQKLKKGELHELSSPFTLLEGLWLNNDQVSIIGQNAIIELSCQSPKKVWQHLGQIEQLTKLLQDWSGNKSLHCSLFGYFGYDFGNAIQGINNKKPPASEPLSYWLLPTKITTYNHSKKTGEEITLSFTNKEQLQLNKFNTPSLFTKNSKLSAFSKLKSNLTKQQYFSKIKLIKQAIIDGETYQTNFAQKFSLKQSVNAIDLFWTVNKVNPSPYQCLIHSENFTIVSNSPELLIKKTSDSLVTKPIKGTHKNKRNLLNSLKDTAELTMIVDLSRNDLSRISVSGTIKVTEHRQIQKLKHLFHTYSTISGQPKKNLRLSQILAAIFPGGSITGCPKLRTMEIINRLEPDSRGAYCGSAGYINSQGDLMLNILIRTLVASSNKLSFHSGGGIVIDSTSENEYNESLRKAQVILDIIDKK